MIVQCASCWREYPPAITLSVCPDCGADGLMVAVHTPGGLRPAAAIGQHKRIKRKVINLVGRDPDSGRESPFFRRWVNSEYSGQRGQWEYVERTLNRPDNSYEEVCYHPISGEITYRKIGRRDDQGMHGPRGKTQ
jgi:hypothetical protein